MSDPQNLTDVLASVVTDGPTSLQQIRERAAAIDSRARMLPIHALEQLLENDERFTSDGGHWSLVADAPVAGLMPTLTEDLPKDNGSEAPDKINEFVVLDVEATDTEPTQAQLIEVAALKVRDWAVVETFETLVYAEDVPQSVTALTGISTGDVRTAPSSPEAVEGLVAFVGDRPIVGQNVGYDIELLQNVDPTFQPRWVLELLELAHILFPQALGRTLTELAAMTGIEVSSAHRAMADCRTTLGIAEQLVHSLNAQDELSVLIRSLLARCNHPWSRLLDPSPPHDVSAATVWSSAAPWLVREIESGAKAPASEKAFGEGGLLQQTSDQVDFRPAQLEMAREVEQELGTNGRLLAEAPTGTGKTYAYLIPGIRRAAQTRKPIWISTNTKALQTQLQSDFARLKDTDVVSGDLAVLKGMDNYICTRDVLAATEVDLDPAAAVEVAAILSLLWSAQEGEMGEASDFWLIKHHPEAAQIKSTLKLNPATCERNTCEFFSVCPYFTAVSNASKAPAVAVNHALLVTMLGADEGETDLAGLIIDEAHTLEDAATTILTEDLDPRAVTAWLNQLINPDSSSGLLRNVGRAFGFSAREDLSFAAALESVRRARKAIGLFAERMATYFGEFVGRPDFGDYPVSHRFRIGVDDRRYLYLEARQALFSFAELGKELLEWLHQLHNETSAREVGEGFHGKALQRRLQAERARADELVALSLTLLTLTNEEFVVYGTWEAADSDLPALTITRTPVDVSDVLRRIYDQAPAVVGTSATLSIGGTFEFMRERLAAADFTTLQVDETFDYSKQASLILTRHLPGPSSSNEEEFVEAVADTAIAAIGTARGGTLGLFTSRKRLQAAFDLSQTALQYEGLELRGQLPGASVRELASWFRDSTAGSLFGLRSFWQGFDAPGDTLRMLLVEKLPFPSPADPVFAARSEALEAAGRDPFYEYAVPLTALSLKQGFGRLIRTKSDRGVVSILDRRVRTGLSYQAEILNSLPADIPIRFPIDEDEFLRDLARDLGVEPRLDLANGVGPQRAVFALDMTTVSHPDDRTEVGNALDEVRRLFRIDSFRTGQEELIRAVVTDKRDVVGLLPTGAGKSLVFQAASMLLDGLGLVVSPLIALMKDQVDGLRNDLGFRWAHALYGGQSGAEKDVVFDAIRSGGCRLLYVSPERLRDPSLRRVLGNCKITFVAVDEAHCVSAWGHDFRPDFLSIVPSIGQLPNAVNAPRIALTATAPDEVFEDISRQLRLRQPMVERASVDRPNIHFSVVKCRNKKEKRSQLLRVAMAHSDVPGIVYCATRNDAESAAALLKSHGVTARHYHAGMPAEQRQAVQEMFMSDQVQVICATNAFGLGIDKPDIGFVAHWSLPLSLDAYYQEAGRAARDSKVTGTAVLIWSPSDVALLQRMAASTLPSIEELERLEREIESLHGPYVTVDELATRTGLDEIATRVGIHLLQDAGSITQGTDVAAKAFVAVPASLGRARDRFGEDVAAELEELVAAMSLTAPGRGVIELIEVATRLEIDATDLEQKLLAMAEGEILGYRPFLRAMSVEPTGTDWDRSKVETRLTNLRSKSFDRLEAMKTYAEKKACRRAQILAHFNESGRQECGFCDICAGEAPPMAKIEPFRYAGVEVVTEQVAQAIKGIVREASRLGSMPGRGSFVKGLKGTRRYATYETPQVLQRSRWFGALRYLTESEINEAIDTMIDRNQILAVEHEHRGGGTYVGLDVRL